MTAQEHGEACATLERAVCDLLARDLGVRLCAVLAQDDAALLAAAAGVPALARKVREAAVAAALEGGGSSGAGDAVALAKADGGPAFAVAVPGTQAVVVAFPRAEETPARRPPGAVATAAVAALGAVRALRRENRLLSHVEALSGIGGWERDGERLDLSARARAIHGLEGAGPVGPDALVSLYPSPARERLTHEMARTAAQGGGFEVTGPLLTPAGERRIVRTVGRGREGGGLYGIAQDITGEFATERRLWWAATHDPVTSLPNRLLFEDRIAVAVRRARREGRRLALVLIEVSGFALLTPSTGYVAPDRQMMEIAARLAAVTRESDTVARISPSEFAIVLSQVDGPDTLAPALARVRGHLADGRGGQAAEGLVVGAGVAFFPDHGGGPDALVRAAATALATARSKPGAPTVVFDSTLADDAERSRATVLSRAREGLARGEFVPFYQPQVDMRSGAIFGVEALVRWRTGEAVLEAKEFSSVLADHTTASAIGSAVLDAVIADVRAMRALTPRPFRVSVNASRGELLRKDFLETFLARSRDGDLSPTDFIIEITEDVILSVDDRALHDTLSFLVSSGVEFALDDFGTGYASLIHIASFPVKEIKIDKAFVSGIERDGRKRAIVHGILQMARSMALDVIAEGVETPAQRDTLLDIGCRYAQGYLYAHPLPFGEFARLLQRP